MKALPPCLVPTGLEKYVGVLQLASLVEGLPRHAVRNGCYMDANVLKNVCAANAVPEPKGTGALNKQGKRGVIKQDWAQALVQHFFPSEDTDPADFQKEKDLMIQGILGQKPKPFTDCPEAVLQAVECLDPNEACVPMFRGLKSMAKEISEENLRKAREAGTRTPRGRSSSNDGNPNN